MQMRMKVLLQNGETFVGRWADCTEKQYNDTIAQMADFMPDLSKVELVLENGDMMLLPKTSAQNCAIFLQKRG